MRALVALCVFALPACQLVFKLDAEPPNNACRHDGLKLCLAFEDDFRDGVARDDGPGHFDGTLNMVDQTERAGEGAADILPNGDIVIEAPFDTFDFPGAFSIDLWARWVPPTQAAAILLDNSSQYTISMQTNGFMHCTVVLADSTEATSPVEQPDDNEWHHVACSIDGVTITSYADGRPIAADPARSAASPYNVAGSFDLAIGRAGNPDNPRGLTSQVDNVRIWDHALTAAEIENFAHGIEGP